MKLVTRREETALLESRLNALPGPLEILEAGCGRHWPLKLSVPHRITGVDTDKAALKIRQDKVGDLDEVIIGDLITTSLPAGAFDIVWCSFVLEHVTGAQAALENLVRWCKPGGLIILRVPDGESVYGFLARHTPHLSHVLYKRWIEGKPNAGKPGFDPYPVVYDRVIFRAGLADFCRSHGLEITQTLARGDYLKDSAIVRIGARLVSALSLGRLAWRHNNLTFIVRKP